MIIRENSISSNSSIPSNSSIASNSSVFRMVLLAKSKKTYRQ